MKRVQHTMIRTHLVLSMFIVYEASSATRLRIGLFYRDLGARWLTTRSLQDIRTGDEEIRIVNQKRKEMRRRSPASCPRFVSRRTGAPGGGGKRMHSGAPPAAAYTVYPIRSDSKVKHETPLTPEYARGKETRTVPRARHPHGSRAAIPERPQSRQSTRPDAWQAAHTQLSNNHSSKTCLARAHMHTLRQVRFLAQRIAAPVPVGAELARLQYFERHLYAFLFVRKLSPYGDEL